MGSGFSIGRIDGSAATEHVALDRDVAAVALGAGDDSLTLGLPEQTGIVYGGNYDGGAGNDALRFASIGPVTVGGEGYDIATVGVLRQGSYTLAAGTLTGFERLEATSPLNLVGGSFAFDEVAAGSVTIAADAALAAGAQAARIAT